MKLQRAILGGLFVFFFPEFLFWKKRFVIGGEILMGLPTGLGARKTSGRRNFLPKGRGGAILSLSKKIREIGNL